MCANVRVYLKMQSLDTFLRFHPAFCCEKSSISTHLRIKLLHSQTGCINACIILTGILITFGSFEKNIFMFCLCCKYFMTANGWHSWRINERIDGAEETRRSRSVTTVCTDQTRLVLPEYLVLSPSEFQ